MNNIVRIGIDLAKILFSLCGVDANDKIVLERTLKRKDLLPCLANLPPCMRKFITMLNAMVRDECEWAY